MRATSATASLLAARRGTRPCRRSRASARAATSWPGCVGEPGVEHALDGGVAVEVRRRSRRAFSQCWRMRTRERLDAAQHEPASNGPGHRAERLLQEARAARASASSFVATKPPTTSEWPPRYFVVECTTTSAPSVERLLQVRRRERVVDDERARRPRAPRRRRARMSTTFSSGFDGVSTQTMRTSLVEVRRRGSRRTRSAGT